MRTAVRALILAATVASGAWLLQDSFSFGLYPEDPVTGRERGCYTDVELALGLKQPSLVRELEQFLSVMFLFGIPFGYVILSFRQRADRVRRKRPEGST